MSSQSLLQQLRAQYQPKLPAILNDLLHLTPIPNGGKSTANSQIHALFPHLTGPSTVKFVSERAKTHSPIRLGVVFSGGQAAGGHNVITGLCDALKKLNPESKLFGFKDGPKGIIENKFIELTPALISPFRNQGGFDLIGSGRTKIETPEQFLAVEATVKALHLNGLVIIGGDDSNTNAAILAEYFEMHKHPISIIGVPKTIDGDLKNEDIEISFGFDTACKTYSEIIGNIMRDSLSAKKYYHFIKLMGRSASHIALECALQTHPNITLIGEEVAAQRKTLAQISHEICDTICARAVQGKNHGVILIPEGIIEFIPEFKQLIGELNLLLASDKPHQTKLSTLNSLDQIAYIIQHLSSNSQHCYHSIPQALQTQLILDRDPHGNVQVSKIETERLFIEVIQQELKERKRVGSYTGTFNALPLFCGYEGRSAFPSNFDAQYCYALGHVAVLLVDAKLTGYICSIQNLAQPIEEWVVGARSIVTMMTTEKRNGKDKPVIKKAHVELNGKPFHVFQNQRQQWLLNDDYCYPGPIQFFGSPELTNAVTYTLQLEHGKG
jgi:pyrophosphate--fructose-6-phosphate 1-phosphotransferase